MNRHLVIDADDVTADFRGGFLEFINQRYGTNFIPDDIENWDFARSSPRIIAKARGVKGLDGDWFGPNYIDFIMDPKYGFASLPVIPEAKRAILSLHRAGFTLSVATDRVTSLRQEDAIEYTQRFEQENGPGALERLARYIKEQTINWYAVHFGQEIFPNQRIIFTNGESKADVCQALDARVLVEDSYRHSLAHVLRGRERDMPNLAMLIDLPHNQGPEIQGVIRMEGRNNREKYDQLLDFLLDWDVPF
jgi:hypothetical protein